MAGTIPPPPSSSDSDPKSEAPSSDRLTGPTGTVRPPAVEPNPSTRHVSEVDDSSIKTPMLPPRYEQGGAAPPVSERAPDTPRILQHPPYLNGPAPSVHGVAAASAPNGAPAVVGVAPDAPGPSPLHTGTYPAASPAPAPHAPEPRPSAQLAPPPSAVQTTAAPVTWHEGNASSTGAHPVTHPSHPHGHAGQPHPSVPSGASAPASLHAGTTANVGYAMAMPGWTPPANHAVTIRSQRGDYVVGQQVGAGNFGAVYECVGPFDQRYALKVLRPSGRPIDKVREEWSREVRRLLELRHPNVVYIHDAFEWEGTFCVALEWCDHTLHDMLEQPLQEELAIELARQMLAAVQYLHDWDLVHDDLHPGNVLIQQADRPIVKISDFGISAELRGAPTVRPEIVHHAIMAPELIAAGYTSKQSDLYQLGMILFWMVTGHPPMDRHVPYDQLVWQISEGVARQRAEQLGTPLGNVIAKMLRRRDAYRYTSAREVWNDLKQLPAWQRRQIFHVR